MTLKQQANTFKARVLKVNSMDKLLENKMELLSQCKSALKYYNDLLEKEPNNEFALAEIERVKNILVELNEENGLQS